MAQKILVVRPGETGVLKKSAKILSVAKDGDLYATSSCESMNERIANAETYVCASVSYSESAGGGGSHPWGDSANEDVAVEFGYLDQRYTINPTVLGDPQSLAANIKSTAPLGVILYAHGENLEQSAQRYEKRVVVKIPESLLLTFYIKWNVKGFGPVKIYALPCANCCPSPAQQV